MKRRPTIVDVARHAGVSKSTVSLVLQNSPLVKDSTRAAVEASMAALHYVRNRSAAQLRGAGPGLIGLVMNDLRNPFFTEFAASAQMTFARAGYATVIANTDEDPAMQAQVVASMVEHGVSAMMICPTYGDDGWADGLRRSGLPVLQVLRATPDAPAFPLVAPDYAEGGAEATRHLIAQGCRRIAFVGGLAGRPITAERMTGYRAEMVAAGLSTHVLPGRPSRALGRGLAGQLVADGVDGALCFSDLVALGLMAGLAEAGVRVGAALRVVGFDDLEEASLAFPQLSSVRFDTAGFARDSATTLLRWIDGGDRPDPVRRAPVRLIVRASSTGNAHPDPVAGRQIP